MCKHKCTHSDIIFVITLKAGYGTAMQVPSRGLACSLQLFRACDMHYSLESSPGSHDSDVCKAVTYSRSNEGQQSTAKFSIDLLLHLYISLYTHLYISAYLLREFVMRNMQRCRTAIRILDLLTFTPLFSLCLSTFV